MMTHFVIFPLFALHLAGQRGWPVIAGPLAGMVSSILTVSRAAIGINGAGFMLVYVLSALQGWTPRKAAIGFIGVILIVAAAPIVISSIERRYATAEAEQSTDTRVAFIRVATMMIHDHPMGVGASNYVRMANIGGYNVRADLPFPEWSIDVHNAFYLATAETGYIGLLAFVGVLLNVMITAFRCGWRNRFNRTGTILLGLGVTLMTVYAHSWFEFIIFFAGVQYAFAITAGLVAGLAMQLGYWPVQSPRVIRTAGPYLAPKAREG
jgi:O-antigen ligase